MTTVSTMPARVDAETLREWLGRDDAPRLLDVRTPAEFGTAHIPGSYNVPLDLLKEHRDELRRHLDDDVVLVCRSGTPTTPNRPVALRAPRTVPCRLRRPCVALPGSGARPTPPSWPP